MKYYTFAKGTFAGLENVLVSATGYTGAGGFEIYVAADQAQALWDAIFEAGKAYNIQPIGLGARDTLRLEMGYCLYGNDIDDTTSPLEAGLGWITKLNKGEFIGRELMLQEKAQGIQRRLVGFQVLDKRPARQGYTLHNAQGQAIGKVTSGTKLPSIEHPIGMGYVAAGYAEPGTEIFIELRGNMLPAKVVKMPFKA
jgi:aminomethyltransferase